MRTSYTLKLCFVFFIGFLTLDAHSQTKKRVKKVSQLNYKISLDWLNGVSSQEPTDSIYNPGNQIFKIPQLIGRSELILDSRFGWGSQHQLIARPRLLFQSFQTQLENPKQQIENSETELEFIELFTNSWLTPNVSFSFGLQNYQWGPAEIMAPSNPIFHFNREQRSLLWREKGHALARLNWTPTPDWSQVLISEFAKHDEEPFILDRKFKPKFLSKTEIRSSRSAEDYWGFTFGTEEESRNFVGTYFTFMMLDGISFYSDFRLTENSYRFVPILGSGAVYNMQVAEDTKDWLHLGVVGLRWETPNIDLRAEWITNGLGYSKTEFRQALDSTLTTNANFTTNISRLNRSGLELLGQNYGYLSLRFPDLGGSGLWQFQLRYLFSGFDESGVAGFSLERAVGNNFVLLSEGRYSIGKKDSELVFQEKYFLFLGLRFLL